MGLAVRILSVEVVVQEKWEFIDESTYVDGLVNFSTVVVNDPHSYCDADPE